MARRIPAVRRGGAREPLHRRRRPRVRRLLPRRHGRDERARAARRRCAPSREQAARGITTMLPTEDALWVAEELTRRFGVTRWQFALTATDANRFSIRLARHVTGRPKVLVFNWCYHGTRRRGVRDARRRSRRRAAGEPRAARAARARRRRSSSGTTSRRSRRRSRPRDVALVLTEPALTNVGIVHPEPGFHDALRALTRDTGTLLAIDETHTICCGPGGFTTRTGSSPTRHGRQADRRRHPGVGVRVHRRAGRPDRRRRSSSRTSTSAASAARSPRTRSRSRRCAPRSPRCSPTRRSRG